jgi:hypothetical protein
MKSLFVLSSSIFILFGVISGFIHFLLIESNINSFAHIMSVIMFFLSSIPITYLYLFNRATKIFTQKVLKESEKLSQEDMLKYANSFNDVWNNETFRAGFSKFVKQQISEKHFAKLAYAEKYNLDWKEVLNIK